MTKNYNFLKKELLFFDCDSVVCIHGLIMLQ